MPYFDRFSQNFLLARWSVSYLLMYIWHTLLHYPHGANAGCDLAGVAPVVRSQHQCTTNVSIFMLVSKHLISACVFIAIKGHRRDRPIFPLFVKKNFNTKIDSMSLNSLPNLDNMDRVHLACKQKSMGCRCRCVHVSEKSKQMQLATIRCSRPWIDGYSGIYNANCAISVEGDDDTWW